MYGLKTEIWLLLSAAMLLLISSVGIVWEMGSNRASNALWRSQGFAIMVNVAEEDR